MSLVTALLSPAMHISEKIWHFAKQKRDVDYQLELMHMKATTGVVILRYSDNQYHLVNVGAGNITIIAIFARQYRHNISFPIILKPSDMLLLPELKPEHDIFVTGFSHDNVSVLHVFYCDAARPTRLQPFINHVDFVVNKKSLPVLIWKPEDFFAVRNQYFHRIITSKNDYLIFLRTLEAHHYAELPSDKPIRRTPYFV